MSQKQKILSDVYDIIQDRKTKMPEGSYVASLMTKGLDSILKKVGEEAGEVIIASKNNDQKEIVHEVADLWFHTLVTLAYHEIPLDAIYHELDKRFKP